MKISRFHVIASVYASDLESDQDIINRVMSQLNWPKHLEIKIVGYDDADSEKGSLAMLSMSGSDHALLKTIMETS